MGVPEIKQPHQWCQHARPGSGCTIYADRPEPCRAFHCRWLSDESLGEHWFPARARIVIDIQQTGDQFVLLFVVDSAWPARWKEEPWFSDIKKLARAGLKIGWTTVIMIKDEKIPILA